MKHKVGETIPNIDLVDAIIQHHTANSKCKNGYIISKPCCRLERISFFTIKYFSVKSWYCPRCNWESERMITRTT